MVLAAVAQMTSSSFVQGNLSTCLTLMKRASALGVKMLFLPEATDYIVPASDVYSLSRPLKAEENEFMSGIQSAAAQMKMWVNVCIHERPEEAQGQRVFNTNVVVDDEGVMKAVYRKMHLFDVDLAPTGPTIKESNTTIAGKELVPPVAGTPIGNLGLQTCYDLRFSGPSQSLLSDAKYPATALTFPSAFALNTGAAHWETLLRARAIEGQCYVFASAQIGEHYAGRRSYGHSMIVDPWGTVVAQCSQTEEPQICIADIDVERVREVRRAMPMGRV